MIPGYKTLVGGSLAGAAWLGGVYGLHGASEALATSIVVGVVSLGVAAFYATSSNMSVANVVTSIRVLAVSALFGGLWSSWSWALWMVAVGALVLDGVDGWIARRRREESAFGARFDMEADAAFIVVLCLWVCTLDLAAGWVVLIGSVRYLFVGAGMLCPRLAAPLPESRFRKAVCVLQVGTLLWVLIPSRGMVGASLPLALSLAALLVSFGRDMIGLLQAPRASARTVNSLPGAFSGR
ncbi:MAG: CDP-alcohol phosphatidyltransferase family protein [Myxococcota bacterium]